MASDKTKTAANAFLFAGLVAGALILLNIFAARFYRQADMTTYKIYSLSPASKSIVKNLDEKMVVTVYESGNLPQQFTAFTQYLDDLLNEYQAASHGNVEWHKVDPTKDDSLTTEAKDAAFITQVPEKDQIRELKGYMGVRFVYKGKTEWFKAADERSGRIDVDPSQLEYDLTTTMRKLTLDHKPKIGLLTGHGELGQGQGEMSLLFDARSSIGKELAANYDTTTVNLNGGSGTIPDDVDMLLVVGPKQKLTDKEAYLIDQFAMKGKPVAFFLDGVVTEAPHSSGSFDSTMAMPQVGRSNDVGLDDLLAAYGFRVNHDVLLDGRPTYGPAELPVRGQQDVTVSTAFMVEPIKANGQGDFAQGVPMAVFPLASSVDRVGPLGDGNQPAGSSLTLVAETSAKSMKAKQDPFFMFGPAQEGRILPAPQDGTEGKHPLAWLYHGPLKSAWAGKPSPLAASTNSSALDPNQKSETQSGSIAVFGTSSFLSDGYVQFGQFPLAQVYSENAVVFLDLVDWGLKDNDLSALRAKGNVTWPLEIEADSKAPTIAKVANLAGLPILVMLLGVARYQVRRRRRATVNITA